MPSSLFQMKRHTRRPPPTCKSSWREGRIALTPFQPAVLTGWVAWKSLGASPPIDVACLIDVYAQSGPTEYFGSTSLPGAVLTLSLNQNANPLLYDLVLSIKTETVTDDDSWHDEPRPLVPCLFDSGILSHIHTPGVDENFARLSV